MSDSTYQPKVYKKDGGDTLVVASGGAISVESGGVVTIAAVGGLKIGEDNVGVATIADVTANAAEINMAADSSVNTEVVTETNVITAAESGKTFFLNSGTEFVSTLPALAAGLRYTFIVTAPPAGANYTIVTNASANIIKGLVIASDGAAAATDTDADVINFVDGQAVAGDRVDVICDGTNWFVYGYCTDKDAITFGTT